MVPRCVKAPPPDLLASPSATPHIVPMRAFGASLLLVLAATAGPARALPAEALVRFDFDDDAVETGPYTFRVFQHAKGSVRLTSDYRYNGYRSVEIRDVAGDGDFAELQGPFPEVARGKLYVHFALMTAEPDEAFNVALAGPAHFALVRDGIGFWLQNRAGRLFQVNGGESHALLETRPFTWYVVDAVIDVDGGTYDLTILEEGREEPRVALRRQPSAVSVPGSKFDRFSFIGDPPGEDGSNARFYVDDIVIAADAGVRQAPFVAPGRRMLFVDIQDHYRALLYREPRCVPVLDTSDFGIGDADLRDLAAAGRLDVFEKLSRRRTGRVRLPDDVPEALSARLRAMNAWRAGCAAPPGCKAPCARELFELAARLAPEAKLYPLSVVLALAAEKRWAEADALFLEIRPDWRGDPRFPAISALLGIARGDLADAESWLAYARDFGSAILDDPSIRRLWSGDLDRTLIDELRSKFPADWADHVEAALVSEQRFYVLLWQSRYAEAGEYAERMAAQYVAVGLPPSAWLERSGDAAFRLADYATALQRYEAALAEPTDATPILLKLSDVHFKLGNFGLERTYRERIYGTLEPETMVEDPLDGVTPHVTPGKEGCGCPAERPPDAAAPPKG